MVHSSLSALGWVSGGPVSVLQALADVISPSGTLVMPAQSQDLTDPVGWENPAVPVAWHDEIRRTMPAYDRQRTPTRDMGRIAELFRTWPGVVRSDHPTCSFAASGTDADLITRTQHLEDPFGNDSPLGRLYERDAQILLLGVGFDCCTALHLAERRAWPTQRRIQEGSPIMLDGVRQWVRYEMPQLRPELLAAAGTYLIETGQVRSGRVGAAWSHLVSCRTLVDLTAQRWRRDETPLPAV